MRLKKGVTVDGVQPESVIGMMVAEQVFRDEGLHFTVTSITDGEHKVGSLHYAGLAFDCRTWADPTGKQLGDERKEYLAQLLRRALGGEFDVVVESTHIHVEFDPD